MSHQREELKRLKLESATERCQAIEESLQLFQGRVESSPATRKVIELILRATGSIKDFIAKESANPDLVLLTDAELESRIHRVTRVIPAIHLLVGIVEHSDITSVPAELAAPLRTEIDTLYSSTAELIITSSPTLNYSIQRLARADLQESLNLKGQHLKGFPKRLFVASLPSIEYDQALQHCIFAHELSHPLWEDLKIQKCLPPLTLDKKKLLQLTERLGKRNTGSKKKGDAFKALEEASRAPQRVPAATLKWCKELTSDLFALALFGPAFLFSVIYFTCSFNRLDSASDSHPPPRLRLNLLFRFLDLLYTGKNVFSPQTRTFLNKWRLIGAQQIRIEEEVHELVLDTLRKSEISNRLPSMALDLLPKLRSQYTQKDYRRDIKVLCPLIDAQIPPAEYLVKGEHVRANFVGILNAGWESYLKGLKGYQAKLPQGRRRTPYEVKRNYNSFLLKALELNDAIRSWRASLDTVQ